MDVNRAHQILESTGNIGVHYQDYPIWIEDINDTKQTARVRRLDTNEIIEAPLVSLDEDDTKEYI